MISEQNLLWITIEFLLKIHTPQFSSYKISDVKNIWTWSNKYLLLLIVMIFTLIHSIINPILKVLTMNF
jgi:hypothetical protein